MNKQSVSKTVAGYQQSRKGKRPIRVHNLLKKAESIAMAIETAKENTMLKNDPLIQYLKKTAAETSPLRSQVDSSGHLENNIDNYPTREPVKRITSMNPGPTPEMEEHARNPLKEYFEEYFDHDGEDEVRKKYTAKDKPVNVDMTPKADFVEQKI